MMFDKVFCRCSDDAIVAISPCKLQETSEKLGEKEYFLQRKVTVEIERAKEFVKAKNREAALRCLKRKKLYEEQIEYLWNFQMRIHDQEQKLLKNLPINGGHPQQITSYGNFQNNTTRSSLRSAFKRRCGNVAGNNSDLRATGEVKSVPKRSYSSIHHGVIA